MTELAFLIALIFLSAFFSGLELALFSISEAKLRSLAEEEGKIGKQAKLVMRVKTNPEKLLVTILIGNNVVNIASASIATALALKLFGNSGIALATGAMTIVVLIFGEIIPKSIAQRKADTIARWTAPITLFLLYVLTPVSFLLEQLARLANSIAGGDKDAYGVSEEEVKAMVHMGSEQGTVEDDEREMIENIFTLNDVSAEGAMTHTNDMVTINASIDVKDVLHIVVETGFSRFPVYSGNVDNIEGILYTKDMMTAVVRAGSDLEGLKLRDLIKPAVFVPEQKALDKLLHTFQTERKHIAIVVNEFGETRGLITLEDILEEIVGDITDEQDEESSAIKRINAKTIIVDADVAVGEIEKALDVELHEDDHKTIAWLILNNLGDLPTKGDELTVHNVKIIIEEAEESKIKRVKLIKIR